MSPTPDLGSHSSSTTPHPPATDSIHRSPENAQVFNQPLTSTPAPAPTQARDQNGKAMSTATYAPVHNDTKLTFFEKYFTRPVVSKDGEKTATEDGAFSFRSIGFLLSATLAVAIIVLILVLAIVLSVNRHRNAHNSPLDDSDQSGKKQSPIRSAIPSNFPDPALYFEKGIWYAYATNNAAGVLNYPNRANNASLHTTDFGMANVQMATSSNFVHWELVSLADQPLPADGAWTMSTALEKADNIPRASGVWSPAVIKRLDGKYVMYYAAIPEDPKPYSSPHPMPHCIGSAVSASPAGPYEPSADFLACPGKEGGAIDPEAIMDVDNTIYAVYKVDGNNIGHGGSCGNTVPPIQPTPIMLQQMDNDGVTKAGDAVTILTNDASDGPLVEAPMLIRSPKGIYFLFFSSGCTRDDSYAVKYATSKSIKGPYTRAPGKLLKSGDWGLSGPGSVGIIEDGEGGWNMAFHARANYGEVGRVRAMFTTKLKFHDTTVTLERDDSTVHLGHQNA